MEFAKATERARGGRISPLDTNPVALVDLLAFKKLRDTGGTTASWNQFSDWMFKTHGINLSANSYVTYLSRRRGA